MKEKDETIDKSIEFGRDSSITLRCSLAIDRLDVPRHHKQEATNTTRGGSNVQTSVAHREGQNGCC